MGRYDKIKMLHPNATPMERSLNRLYVQGYANRGAENLIDFGTYDSANTNTLKVYTADHLWERVTLDKHVTIIPGAKHTTGSFKLDPASGYCSSTKAVSGHTVAAQTCTWYFKTKVRRHTFTTDAFIFRCGNSSNAPGIWIKWLNTGEFELMRAWSSTNRKYARTTETFLEPDRVYEISFTINKGTNNAQIQVIDTVTGIEYTSAGDIVSASNFILSNATNTVGSSEIELLDYVRAQGIRWKNSSVGTVYTRDINLNEAASGTASGYIDLHMTQDPDTEIVEWV